MKRNQKLMAGLSAAVLSMGSSLALAETVTVPATVTVNNAINFTFTGTLDFGQVRAKASPDVSKCIGLQLPSDTAATLITPAGTTTAYDAACLSKTDSANGLSLQGVGGTPARPVFTIAGVAPFTPLKLVLPTTAVNLTAATGPDTAQFQLVDFTGYKTSGTVGAVTNVTGITTDAGGGATFTVGATLITHPGAVTTSNYQDLPYSGSFTVAVTY